MIVYVKRDDVDVHAARFFSRLPCAEDEDYAIVLNHHSKVKKGNNLLVQNYKKRCTNSNTHWKFVALIDILRTTNFVSFSYLLIKICVKYDLILRHFQNQ